MELKELNKDTITQSKDFKKGTANHHTNSKGDKTTKEVESEELEGLASETFATLTRFNDESFSELLYGENESLEYDYLTNEEELVYLGYRD